MRPALVLLSMAALPGCLDNRATAIHPPMDDQGYAWIGDHGSRVADAPLRIERAGHLPQSLVVDAWRTRLERPTWAAWLALDRVQQRTWPQRLPATAWLRTWPAPIGTTVGRRWIRLGDVGSPASVPECEILERSSFTVSSPIPWWQCFPCDIGPSFVPTDIPSHAVMTVTYAPVAPYDLARLQAEAAGAGYLTPHRP